MEEAPIQKEASRHGALQKWSGTCLLQRWPVGVHNLLAMLAGVGSDRNESEEIDAVATSEAIDAVAKSEEINAAEVSEENHAVANSEESHPVAKSLVDGRVREGSPEGTSTHVQPSTHAQQSTHVHTPKETSTHAQQMSEPEEANGEPAKQAEPEKLIQTLSLNQTRQGPFLLTPKQPTAAGGTARRYGGFQATCPFHKKSSVTACKKYVACRGPLLSDKARAIQLLLFWCSEAQHYTRQWQHLQSLSSKGDVSALPAASFLWKSIGQMKRPEGPVKSDAELDLQDVTARAKPQPKPTAKGKAKAKDKPAAKTAPQPKVKAKAKAKASPGSQGQDPCRRSSSSSSSSSSSGTSSSSSSSSSSS